MQQNASPVARLWNLVREENSDISTIYFFAILNGFIQLSLPVGIQSIIGFILGGTLSASLVVLIVVLVTGVLFAGLLQINQMKVIERIQQRIFVRYSYAFADRIPRLDLKQVDPFYLPELVNRFFDTVSLQKSISKILLDLPAAMIQIVFGLTLLSFYHSAFILFGVLLLFILCIILYATGSKGLKSSLAESAYKYQVVAWFEEMARIVKAFKFSLGAGLHLKKANDRTISYLNARTRHFLVLLLQYKTLVVFKVIITSAMLVVGTILLLNQQINIGQFVAAEIIILTVISSIEKIVVNLDSVYDVLTAVEKIGKLTDKPVEPSGDLQVKYLQPPAIEARHLGFAYEADKFIFKDVSFRIMAGQKSCIMGKDGSGKSTLLKLATGIYQDFTGSLLVNNIPIGNYDLLSLREHTGIVFPDQNIFQGTLWENITMGRQDIDAEWVGSLASHTGLDPFLATLPAGYNTELDPAGKRLSRNVMQKILLVRAMAHKPKLLIMEDPWNGIEEKYKISIQQLLIDLKETTLLLATNDEDFARRCDEVIRLGN